jgi:hypothetical protein
MEERSVEQLEAYMALAMERVIADVYKGRTAVARHHRRQDLDHIEKWRKELQEMTET